MSLMWKLSATVLLLSSLACAQNSSDDVADFLEDQFSNNPRLKSVDVEVDSVVPVKEVKGWNAYIVDVKAVLKQKNKKSIDQKMIWFSNGDVITKDLIDLKSGQNLVEVIKPQFKDIYYKAENLIYGDKNASHKIVIFSDPLCPFCKGFVPVALPELKKEPNKFAVYYYHLPLVRLHPASATLVRAAVAAELKGVKDVILRLYTVKVNPREKDVNKILAAFNKVEGTNITIADINSDAVKKQIKSDAAIANDLMVRGTPTVYLDGKIDKTRKKYLKVK
ncbi:Secreted protein, suppressor for copper-sensitivity ScsC [hydrothermal vent metagenome]|uniref:Secreted protein, suppressor for copper-sensitivity ScsC n=1 Tax=hydrothermal vent metagenome TaxID=652676 RepID=A0A1W1BTV5_9ZZZZ